MASAVVDAGAQVVAVDGDSVYYVDVAGAHELLPGGGTAVETVSPRDLLDVRSRIRAFQLDEDTIEVVQSSFSVEFQLPGLGAAALSRTATSWRPGWRAPTGSRSTTPAPAWRSRTAYPRATTWSRSRRAPGSR